MQDLQIAIDNKKNEITDFITISNQEREKLVDRLNELDSSVKNAESDMKKLYHCADVLNPPETTSTPSLAGEVRETMRAKSGY